MSVVAIFNQKEAVGKTTTAVSLVAAYGRLGRTSCAIDLDPQARFSAVCGVEAASGDDTLLAGLRRTRTLRSLLQPTADGGVMLPSHPDLALAETGFGKGFAVINRLNAGLRSEQLSEDVRPTIIDCNAQLGVLTLNAIFACDAIIVPVAANHASVAAAQQVEKALNALERVLKRRVPRRYLLTRFDTQGNIGWDVHRLLEQTFGAEVCRTKIADVPALADAPGTGLANYQHTPTSRTARDYDGLLDELMADGFLR